MSGIPEAPRPSVYNKNGSINEQVVFNRYGIGIKEATKKVRYRDAKGVLHEDTALNAFNDPKCPLGRQVEGEYQKNGIDGVVQMFGAIKTIWGEDFDIEVAPETIERNRRQALQTRDVPKVVEEQVSKSESPVSEQSPVVQPAPAVQPEIFTEQHVHVSPMHATEPEIVQDIPAPLSAGQSTPHEYHTIPQDVKVIPVTPREYVGAATALPQEHTRAIAEPQKPVVKEKQSVARVESAAVGRRSIPAEIVQTESTVAKTNSSGEKAKEKEIAIQSLADTIDTFLLEDRKDRQKTEDVTVGMIQKENSITLGVRNAKTDAGLEKSKPHLKPVSTSDELILMLDLLNQLTDTTKNVKAKGANGPGAKADNIDAKERYVSKEKPDVTLLVSENILLFIEKGEKMFDGIDGDRNQEMHTEKQFVRISSDTREVFVELTRLKKLIELVKVRKQMQREDFIPESFAIPEELGLHGVSYRGYDDDMSFWKLYLNMIVSLPSDTSARYLQSDSSSLSGNLHA